MPVINRARVEVAYRAVYWIAQGIKRKKNGHNLLIKDEQKTLMFVWMDLTTGKVMKLHLHDLVKQRQEVEQVFGAGTFKKLKSVNGRKELFECQ